MTTAATARKERTTADRKALIGPPVASRTHGRSDSKQLNLFLWSWIARDHNRTDATTGPEFAFDLSPFGLGGADDIFKHPVDDVLLKNSQVAITSQIFL